MTYVFFFICAIILAILETVGFSPFLSGVVYDLQIPLVIAVSVLGRTYLALIVIFLVAVVMDTLSGGPFGIYLTTYVWLFFPVKALSLLVSTRSYLAVALLSVLGVLFENFVFMFVQLLTSGAVANFHTVILPLVITQCITACITGPIIYFLLEKGHGFVRVLEGGQKHDSSVI